MSSKIFKRLAADAGNTAAQRRGSGPAVPRGNHDVSGSTAAGVAQNSGLELIFQGQNPVVDIVAVHGLNGHRRKTWTADNGVDWLRDFLPSDIPHSRIVSWGYDAKIRTSVDSDRQSISDNGRALVSDLIRMRRDGSLTRPIIFIAHSLGGIIVKSALIHSYNSHLQGPSRQQQQVDHSSVMLSTHGILFMGTPHTGGNGVRLGQFLINLASVFTPVDDHLIRHLARDSELLQRQLAQYGPISGAFVTKFAYELYETRLARGARIMIVPRDSAVVAGQKDGEPVGIHADHRNMVKFSSRRDASYVAISEHLQIMVRDIQDRMRYR